MLQHHENRCNVIAGTVQFSSAGYPAAENSGIAAMKNYIGILGISFPDL
jgi:hypothetical protein